MKEMKFSIEINAPKEKVWDTLWQDETFRDWSNLIDPGTYMVGELKQGSEVQFLSAENGYGVTSKVVELIDNEYLVLNHEADTQDGGEREREKQWTGGQESYSLVENNGITTLTGVFDVPAELEDMFNESYPKAFGRIKELAERQLP